MNFVYEDKDEINNVEKNIEDLKNVLELLDLNIDNIDLDFPICKQCNKKYNVKYGGTKAAKELMKIVRSKMIKKGYVEDWFKKEESENLSINKIKENRIAGIKNNTEYKIFDETYKLEISEVLNYFEDGWEYDANEAKEDPWVVKKDYQTHIYYNELDHYITYLVSTIARNKEYDGKEKGIKTIEDDVKKLKNKEIEIIEA